MDPRGQPADAAHHRSSSARVAYKTYRVYEKLARAMIAPAPRWCWPARGPAAIRWPTHAGVTHKALIEVGGRTMVERVVEALAALSGGRPHRRGDRAARAARRPRRTAATALRQAAADDGDRAGRAERDGRGGAAPARRAAAGDDRRPCACCETRLGGGVPGRRARPMRMSPPRWRDGTRSRPPCPIRVAPGCVSPTATTRAATCSCWRGPRRRGAIAFWQSSNVTASDRCA